MAGTFKFELVSPERILMSVEAEQVIVPGAEGQFTVLEGHAPVVSTLLPGVIHVTTPSSKQAIFVRFGFCRSNRRAVDGPRRTRVHRRRGPILDSSTKNSTSPGRPSMMPIRTTPACMSPAPLKS